MLKPACSVCAATEIPISADGKTSVVWGLNVPPGGPKSFLCVASFLLHVLGRGEHE